MGCGFGHNLDADLSIKGTKIWDEAKVRRLYTKKAADVMLRNHVPESSKSCAYFIYHNNCFVNGLNLSANRQKLENARLLQRHKFLWSSVLLGTLPVKSQLKKIFKSEKYSTCFFCNLSPETIDHIFLHCSFIRSLWFMSPWGLRTDHWSSLTMLQWFEFLTDGSLVANSIGVSSKELLLFTSVMMDNILDDRNRLAHGSDSNNLDVLIVANSTLLNYFEMKNKLLLDVQEGSDDCPDGWCKAHFGIAMTEEESWAAALLLNHEGKLIGARTRKLSTKFLLEQEALALDLAVELAFDVVPKSNICLEGDCESVIPRLNDYLNAKVNDRVLADELWYLKPLLMNVCDKLGSMGDWKGKRIWRNFNWVAYNAAKWAAFCNNEGDVLDSVPAIEELSNKDFVSSLFANDDDDDEHDHGSFLNNSDIEDDKGLLRLKLKDVFTHQDGNNDNK